MWKHLNFIDSITSAFTNHLQFSCCCSSKFKACSLPNTKLGAYVLPSSYVFVYRMLMFSLSVLKENFNLVGVACTGKCSLLIVNTDSPISMSTFSNSTYFLGVLEPKVQPLEAVALMLHIRVSHPVQSLPPLLLLKISTF